MSGAIGQKTMSKPCNRCGGADRFPPSKTSGKYGNCRPCWEIWYKQDRKAKPEKYRTYEHRRNYGLEPEEYQDILRSQNFACAICKETDNLNVDHNHETDEVRGILCRCCNLMLGYAKDSTDTLFIAIEYLKSGK